MAKNTSPKNLKQKSGALPRVQSEFLTTAGLLVRVVLISAMGQHSKFWVQAGMRADVMITRVVANASDPAAGKTAILCNEKIRGPKGDGPGLANVLRILEEKDPGCWLRQEPPTPAGSKWDWLVNIAGRTPTLSLAAVRDIFVAEFGCEELTFEKLKALRGPKPSSGPGYAIDTRRSRAKDALRKRQQRRGGKGPRKGNGQSRRAKGQRPTSRPTPPRTEAKPEPKPEPKKAKARRRGKKRPTSRPTPPTATSKPEAKPAPKPAPKVAKPAAKKVTKSAPKPVVTPSPTPAAPAPEASGTVEVVEKKVRLPRYQMIHHSRKGKVAAHVQLPQVNPQHWANCLIGLRGKLVAHVSRVDETICCKGYDSAEAPVRVQFRENGTNDAVIWVRDDVDTSKLESLLKAIEPEGEWTVQRGMRGGTVFAKGNTALNIVNLLSYLDTELAMRKPAKA